MAASKNKLTREEENALYLTSETFRANAFFGFDYVEATHSWEERSEQLQAARLQPYNDLLFQHITHTVDFRRCCEQLMEKIKVATDRSDLCVPIWEFKHYNMPYDYRKDAELYAHVVAAREGNPDALQAETIHANGWRGLVGMTGIDEWYGDTLFRHPLVEIDRVFRKTDLKERLALQFGGIYFTVSVRHHAEVVVIDGQEYYPIRSEVMLNYFPGGVLDFKRKLMGRAALKYKDYVSPPLASTDKLMLEDGKGCIARRQRDLGAEGHI